MFQYSYDAWNRLVSVTKAYRDSGGTLQSGSVVQVSRYDGLGRRIVKEVKNSADLDATYHFYYEGQSVVEVRNGSGMVLQQYVWAGRAGGYVDELIQLAHNADPLDGTEQDCERFYYALQNANFNVLGLIAETGEVVERYEYMPYGQ